MNDKPKIIFDPFPRNEEMVYTSDVEKELNEISNLIAHFGSRAPDDRCPPGRRTGGRAWATSRWS